MKIELFGVEDWMNRYETTAVYNLAETCVDSLTLRELLALDQSGENPLHQLMDRRLTYGDIQGAPALRTAIASLYQKIPPEQILTAHGAIGANQLVIMSLVEPKDHVVVTVPTYQQLYSLPEALGARVDRLRLLPEESYLPNLRQLRELVRPETKMVCLNNPNNPTGALIPETMMREIVQIAGESDAWLFCDEVYRGMMPDGVKAVTSVADLYDKGVATGSFSKVFSLAGLRLGWVAGPTPLIDTCSQHRDYNTISCSMIDEALAVIAITNRKILWQRNRELLHRNLQLLDDWMAEEARVSYVKPQAGTTAFLKVDTKLSTAEFCRRLMNETGTMLVPGSCFEEEGFVRMGYACDEKTLLTGLEKLSQFLKIVP